MIGVWIFLALVVAVLITLMEPIMGLGGVYKNYYCYKCNPPWYIPMQNITPICDKCGELMEEYEEY